MNKNYLKVILKMKIDLSDEDVEDGEGESEGYDKHDSSSDSNDSLASNESDVDELDSLDEALGGKSSEDEEQDPNSSNEVEHELVSPERIRIPETSSRGRIRRRNQMLDGFIE